MSWNRNEDGSSTIESALIVGLLLMIAMGAVEYGLAFTSWMSAVSSSREAARVAAQAGDEIGVTGTANSTDCAIIEAAAGPLVSASSDVIQLWIYESDTSGTVSATNRQIYRRSVMTDTTPLMCGSGNWTAIQNGWPAGNRDNDGLTRDWVGVRVVFDHAWVTGFLWFDGSVCSGGTSGACWSQDTVIHIEPDPG